MPGLRFCHWRSLFGSWTELAGIAHPSPAKAAPEVG